MLRSILQYMMKPSVVLPAFKSVGTAVLGASPTVGLPSSHGAGDILIIAIVGNNTNVTSPAGWSVGVNQTSQPRVCCFYKTDSGAESPVSITGGGGSMQSIMLAYTGSSGLDTNGTAMTPAVGTTATTNSLTTTAANSIVINIFVNSFNTGLGGTWTLPITGNTTRYDGGGQVSSSALLVTDEVKVAAGATTARVATNSQSASSSAFSISFKP